MQCVSQAEARRKDFQTAEYSSRVWSYFGEVAAVREGPQVFLVDMPEPGSTIRPHFHDVDQYQIIVGGDGRLGKDPVDPVAFHYADAYTPYGPIVGGDHKGLSFMTIRAGSATGYFPMPGSRHLMPGKAGRNIAGKFKLGLPLPASGQTARETLIATDDGVEVVGLRFGPDTRAAGEPADAGDQFYLVCAGSLILGGKEVPRLTLIRVEAGEPTPQFQSGPAGAEILLAQLPAPSARPGSDPKKASENKAEYVIPANLGFSVKQ